MASYELEEGIRPHFLRYYERLYSVESSYGSGGISVLVFEDGKWTGKNKEFYKETEIRMKIYHQELYPNGNRKQYHQTSYRTWMLMPGEVLGYYEVFASEELHKLTGKYLSLKKEYSNARYFNLFQFFSHPSMKMELPIIKLISDYAEDVISNDATGSGLKNDITSKSMALS